MLIKYLNDLERAVQRAQRQADDEAIGRCVDCVAVLQDYLVEQVEPIQRKGFEIMAHLLPPEYGEWSACCLSARRRALAAPASAQLMAL